MSTSVASVVSHFPEAENGFTTTTAGSVGSGAGTVTLNSVAGYTNGEPVVLVIDPTDAAKKQTFTGIVDTGGVQVTSVVWTAGTNQTHALGATVVDYATATHISMISKGIKVEHSQDGTHKAALITSRTADTAPLGADSILTYDLSATALKKVTLSDLFKTPPVTESTMSATDWKEGVLPAQSGTIVNNGNRSYDIPFASTVANILSPGMRLRTTRTVSAPAGSFYFDGVNDYFSKTTPNKLTFTDNFTCSGWVNLLGYQQGGIISRFNGTSGFTFRVEATGQLSLVGFNAAAGNYRWGQTYQSIPLNKWTHVAASWATGTLVLYIDGLVAPSATTTAGTAPTAIVQAGDLQYGATNGSGFLSGRGAQFAVFDAVLSAATIRSYSSQTLSGSETNLKTAHSGAGLLDLNTTTPNDMTASGALSGQGYSPYCDNYASLTTDYELVMKVNGATATVQVPEGCTIPTSGGVSAVAYSTATSPFGFTLDKGRWEVATLIRTRHTQSSAVANTWYNLTSTSGVTGGSVISIPTGNWTYGYNCMTYITRASAGTSDGSITISTANNTESTKRMTTTTYFSSALASSNPEMMATHTRQDSLSLSAQTTYYLNTMTRTASTTTLATVGDYGDTVIYAIPAGV